MPRLTKFIQAGMQTQQKAFVIGEEFIGNDKVCLRVQTEHRKNLNEVLRIIDKFEDKYEHKLSQKNPHFMKNGWTKVKYNLVAPKNE